MEKAMDSSEVLRVETFKDVRDKAQALVSEQRNQLHGAAFIEGTSLAVSELNDDDTPTDPALIDALKADCDSLEAQIKEVQKRISKERSAQHAYVGATPRHLRKIQVLEAKRNMYAAEVTELQKREPTFAPAIQANPDYIKSMARQEAKATVAQLEETIQRQRANLVSEREGLENDKIMLKELESMSKALDIRLRALEKRGGKLRQIKQRNHVKELERRQNVLDGESNRVTQGLVSFLDKHFSMTEEVYRRFYAIAYATPAKPQQVDDEGSEQGDNNDEEGNGNRKGRKRRRNSADEEYQQQADVKVPVLNMKLMLQTLMNKSVSSSPYVNWIASNWFEAFVELLINAGVADPHPEEHGLIRLADFL